MLLTDDKAKSSSVEVKGRVYSSLFSDMKSNCTDSRVCRKINESFYSLEMFANDCARACYISGSLEISWPLTFKR